MLTRHANLVVAAMLVTCVQTTACALTLKEATADLEEHIEPGSAIGAGAMYAERPYRGVDTDAYPVPLAVLEYRRFFIDGMLFGVNLVKADTLTLSVAASPRFDGYSADDSPDLAGMQERAWGFDAGARALLKKGIFSLSVVGLTDVSGTHEGQEVSAIVSALLFEGACKPRVGVRWLSGRLVDYYYGVRPFEAQPQRPAYEPDETCDYVAGIRVAVPVGKHWALVVDAQYEALGKEIEDSPIVEKEGLARFVTGAVYRF